MPILSIFPMRLQVIILFILGVSVYSQTLNVIPLEFTESSTGQRYDIKVSYPKVDFGPDALMGLRGIAQDINYCSDTLKDNRVNEFKAEVKNLPKEPCAQQKSMLEVSYKTVFNNSNLISFSFETVSSPDCANHPYTYITTLNYSTTAVGAFGISDIFKKDTPYLKFISEYCINELKARARNDKLENVNEMIEQGTYAKEENFRVFTVTDNDLTIIFNPYKVGPWIWGIQSVTIPYSKMMDMIDLAGPLGITLNNKPEVR
jgi:hypothetical protein